MSLWQDILKESCCVKDNIRSCVGNGTKIRFWTNLCVGIQPLSIFFPSLFDIIVNKLVTVVKVWDQSMGNGSWNLNFLRDFNIWEGCC